MYVKQKVLYFVQLAQQNNKGMFYEETSEQTS